MCPFSSLERQFSCQKDAFKANTGGNVWCGNPGQDGYHNHRNKSNPLASAKKYPAIFSSYNSYMKNQNIFSLYLVLILQPAKSV